MVDTDPLNFPLDKAVNKLSDYSVGFAKLVKTKNSEDAVLAGSGTLVSVDGRHAILTADHVLEFLPNRGKVGLILPTRFPAHIQKPTIDMQLAQKVTIGRGDTESAGPDIGALLLPLPIVDIIRRTKSFYNISKGHSEVKDMAVKRGVWIICGFAEEWTCAAAPEHGYQKVKIFRGLCGLGIVSDERKSDQFDYLDFEAKYGEMYAGPESFQGCSGGGIWQLDVAKNRSGEYVIENTILSGVIFFQYDWKDDCKTIVCHGRQSVYEAAAEAIMNAS